MTKIFASLLLAQFILIHSEKTSKESFVDHGLIFTKVDLEDDFSKNKLMSLTSHALFINTTMQTVSCQLVEVLDKDPEEAWFNSTVNEKATIETYIIHVSLKKIVYKQKKSKASCSNIGVKKIKCRIDLEERKSKNGTALSLVKLEKIQCPISTQNSAIGGKDAKKAEKKSLITQLTKKFSKNKDEKTSNNGSESKSSTLATSSTTKSKGIGGFMKKFVG